MENINLQKINSEQRYNFTILDNEIFFDNRLNIYQKHLLWFFNIVSINKDYSHYSIKKIALITKISEATIIRNIPTLIELGYVEKIQKKLQNGFNQNYYFLKPIKKVDFKTLIKQYNTLSDSKSIDCHTDSVHAVSQQVYTLSDSKSIDCHTDSVHAVSQQVYTLSDSKSIDCHTDSVHAVSQQVYTLSDSKLNNINYNNINEEECVHTPIDNSYYDITTNTYTNIEHNKWEKFCNELCRISSKYLGGTATYIRGIHSFRTQENYEKLQALFNNCKYDIFKCVELAEKDAENSNIKYRWTDFLKCLGIYANNGYPTENKTETNNYSHVPSYNEIMQAEAERKAKQRLELENEAKSKGITVAELKAEHEKEIEENIDDIKNMLGFGNLSEAIENSTIGVKELPKDKEYKPEPYTPKKLSDEDENQIQDLIKKARENSKHNKS